MATKLKSLLLGGNRSWPFGKPSARSLIAVLVCMSLLPYGCATRYPAPEITPSVHSSSDGGLVDRLATVPRIVADEQPVDLSGFEITGEERERLQAQRSDRIHENTVNPFNKRGFWGECLIHGFVVFCPFMAALLGFGVLTYNAGAVVVGAAKHDTYIPPEGIGVRLAALFNDHARSRALRDEVSRRISMQPNEQPEFPRLVVRVESAKLVPVDGGATFEVTARSQAITAPDKKGVQMTHRFTSARRKVDEWLASNGKLFHDDLDAAVDALSASVVSVYMLEQPIAPGR